MRYLGLLILFVLAACARTAPARPVCTGPLVVIDAGHGGKDEGCAPCDVAEKKLALDTAHHVRNYLRGFGYRVMMTRTADTFVDLDQRVALANDVEGDLFVSLHFNAAESKKAKGIEIFYHKDETNEQRTLSSKALGEAVLDAIIPMTGRKSRGVKVARFRVIRNTRMPAVLVEGGFLSNPEEKRVITGQGYVQRLAFGIARGVDNYVQEQYCRPRRESNARPAA